MRFKSMAERRGFMVPLGFGWSKTISRRRHEIKSAVALQLTAYDGFSKMTARAPCVRR
jgi:hypothetical protein